MVSFEPAVEYVMRNEGGLEENPNDPGGITNKGVSLRFLKAIPADKRRAYGIVSDTINEDDIRQLTSEQAKSIYYGEFWADSDFEELTNQDTANYLFDIAVNEGIAPAIKCLQRAIWSVMQNKSIIVDDGIMGNETIHYAELSGIALLPALRSERAGEYRLIAAIHHEENQFLSGWLKRAYNHQ